MGVHRVTETFGDDHLSSQEKRLWDLSYYCLLKFGCPVMFNVYGPNVPLKIDQTISFFVPVYHLQCEEVRAFILDELKDEVRKGELHKFPVPEGLHIDAEHVKKGEDGIWYTEQYFNGCSVEVFDCTGPNFYLENLYSKPLIKKMTDKFMSFLDSLRKEKIVH